MSTTQTVGGNTLKLSAKIAAELFLGKIRLNPRQGEPAYLPRLKQLALQLKKTLGAEGYNELAEDLRPVAHAFADALFDELTETRRDETKQALLRLSVPHRMAVETLVATVTGKKDERKRWPDDIWDIKQNLRLMTDLSITGVTLAEIREGYDPLIHAIIDELWENRAMLLN